MLALNRILGQKLVRARLFPSTVQAQGVVPDREARRPAVTNLFQHPGGVLARCFSDIL